MKKAAGNISSDPPGSKLIGNGNATQPRYSKLIPALLVGEGKIIAIR
jgi:hypothetical protein